MTDIELTTRSSGNIGIYDRAVRVVLGLSILLAALYASINGENAYPYVKVIASAVVLTGIAGWDPFYAIFRSIAERLHGKSGPHNPSFKPV